MTDDQMIRLLEIGLTKLRARKKLRVDCNPEEAWENSEDLRKYFQYGGETEEDYTWPRGKRNQK